MDVYFLKFVIRCSQHTTGNYYLCDMSNSNMYYVFRFLSIDEISLCCTYLFETSQEFIPMISNDLHLHMTTEFQSFGNVSV